jgi:hypothetical protein
MVLLIVQETVSRRTAAGKSAARRVMRDMSGKYPHSTRRVKVKPIVSPLVPAWSNR